MLNTLRTIALASFALAFASMPARGETAARLGPLPGVKIVVVIFENTDYSAALAQPFFRQLQTDGAGVTNVIAETHPSQPNYLALVSGSMQGVTGDGNVTVNARHLGDLLEAHGKTWKVYAEDFPGNCYLGATTSRYARKHVPFVSFRNIQTSPERCARIVSGTQFQSDLTNGTLPDFSLYVPNMNNDAHDTGVAFADSWYSSAFGPLLHANDFSNVLLISTFDESSRTGGNHIYTSFYGKGVAAGSHFDQRTDHYALLRTIEDLLDVGNLGQNDASAAPITGIWQ